MEQLRRLDESAVRPGSTVAIILGTIGALLLGLGYSEGAPLPKAAHPEFSQRSFSLAL